MKKLHLVMPMGGSGLRFSKEGFEVPKPLIQINNKPFFVWSAYSITKFIDVIDITFVVLQEHVNKFNIDKIIVDYFPFAKIIIIPHVLDGAALTCLEACKTINDNNYILFNDCDHMFKSSSLNDFFFHINQCDAGLVTFESNEPQFSFIEYDERGNIIGTKEKQCVSNRAIVGAYLFKNASLYKQVCQEYLQECNYSEFFVSGIFNIICRHHGIVKEFSVDFHVNYGTPVEYEAAKKSCHFSELI